MEKQLFYCFGFHEISDSDPLSHASPNPISHAIPVTLGV